MIFNKARISNGLPLNRYPARALLVCMIFVAGCATTNGGSSQTQNIELAIKEADSELSKGQREKAVALLTQNAKENPTSTVLWLKIANIWFDVGNYPSSILAANEVLQRDASNQEAKSLLVVTGLRVAAGAVNGLRSANSVNSSARMEAENLTNTLRSMLGEKTLVPSSSIESKQAASTARPKAIHNKSFVSSTSPSAGTTGTGQSVSNASSTDPFKSLK
jgi:hypothetical protein